MNEEGGRLSSLTWIVGVAAVIALAAIALNTLRTPGIGSRGLARGAAVPPFAAPYAIGGANADANVAARPGQGGLGGRAACSVRGPAILNSCELGEGGSFALVFFATRSSRCEAQVSALERASASVPGVRLAAVAIRGDRAAVVKAVHRHGWRLPVAWDRDGAVANLFAIAVCPTITFARAGHVVSTTLGSASPQVLATRLREVAGK